jgi:hypothetical protein
MMKCLGLRGELGKGLKRVLSKLVIVVHAYNPST